MKGGGEKSTTTLHGNTQKCRYGVPTTSVFLVDGRVTEFKKEKKALFLLWDSNNFKQKGEADSSFALLGVCFSHHFFQRFADFIVNQECPLSLDQATVGVVVIVIII